MNRPRGKYTHITEDDYKSIKNLQKAGVNQHKTSRATKRAATTVGRIYETNSFEEYKELTTERNNSYRKDKQPVQLASTNAIFDVIKQAKAENGIILTTHTAFVGFDDMYDFIKEASDNEVTVTFAPMGRK
jgi:IS30 family transposase